MSNGDVYRDAQVGWVCPLCKRANAPWVRQCDCKEAVNTKPIITIADSGTTAPTGNVIWTHANFQESLERSLTENAAVYQALAD